MLLSFHKLFKQGLSLSDIDKLVWGQHLTIVYKSGAIHFRDNVTKIEPVVVDRIPAEK